MAKFSRSMFAALSAALSAKSDLFGTGSSRRAKKYVRSKKDCRECGVGHDQRGDFCSLLCARIDASARGTCLGTSLMQRVYRERVGRPHVQNPARASDAHPRPLPPIHPRRGILVTDEYT